MATRVAGPLPNPPPRGGGQSLEGGAGTQAPVVDGDGIGGI